MGIVLPAIVGGQLNIPQAQIDNNTDLLENLHGSKGIYLSVKILAL